MISQRPRRSLTALTHAKFRVIKCCFGRETLSRTKSSLYTGQNNDRDLILLTIGGITPTNSVTGYLLADVNLDGTVLYTGQNNDRDIILTNIGGVVPTATVLEQMP
ncbi:MAG: hypothetical protein IPI91_12955 [Flavobacteriales bacterium]|nr:hypothetical protein [Flavobacteriales bacterium]